MKIKTFTFKKTMSLKGVTVLSKDGEWPVTYTNYKQADNRRDELRASGIDCDTFKPFNSRNIYVRINNPAQINPGK